MSSRKGRKGNWSPEEWEDCYSIRWQRADAIRRAVLDAAIQLLEEVGPRAFTVKEVAARAGVGRTTVYKYFGIKAELLAACRAERARSRGRSVLWSAWAVRSGAVSRRYRCGRSRLSPALEKVRQAMMALADGVNVDTDLFLLAAAEGVRSLRRPRRFHGAFPQPPEVAPATAVPPVPDRYLSAVVELLREAQRAGELRPGLDAQTVAQWLTALWWYRLCVQGPRREPAPAAQSAPAAIAAHAVCSPQAGQLATELERFLAGVGVG